jgi:hypothetical protein
MVLWEGNEVVKNLVAADRNFLLMWDGFKALVSEHHDAVCGGFSKLGQAEDGLCLAAPSDLSSG